MEIRMASHGLLRLGVCTPSTRVADVVYNCEQIRKVVTESTNCRFFLFPELCLTAYTCGDLFYQPLLVEKARKALVQLAEFTAERRVTVVVGAPIAASRTVVQLCGIPLRRAHTGDCPQDVFTQYPGILRRTLVFFGS